MDKNMSGCLPDHHGFKLENVTYAYGEFSAVCGLNIEFLPGRLYGLLGPNGSGKTTLIDILAGYRKPWQGNVSLEGRRIQDYSQRQLARKLALVPQDFSMHFDFTVSEAVLMGRNPHIPRFMKPSDEDHAIADEAMKTLGIFELRDRCVTRLSGGEKQRVAVARAFAQNTGILLLDEATANLDIRHSIEIFRIARQRVNERGDMVIAAIHDLNLAAAFCDEVVLMKSGKIISAGHSFNSITAETIMDVFGVEGSVFFDSYADSPQVSLRYAESEKSDFQNSSLSPVFLGERE